MCTDASIAPQLRRSSCVDLKHMTTFDVLVVSGRSLLQQIVEGVPRFDFDGCAVIAGNGKLAVRCLLSGWLSSGQLYAISTKAGDNDTWFQKAVVAERVLVGSGLR